MYLEKALPIVYKAVPFHYRGCSNHRFTGGLDRRETSGGRIEDMKKRIRGWLLSFLVVLPFAFSLAFLAYFPVHYDFVLYTDNVVGEGICQSFGSMIDGRTMPNRTTFYFGSELKKATIRGTQYDVDTLMLSTYDVSSYDITGIESWYRGIRLRRFAPADILPEGETVEGTKARLSSENGALHVEIFDPDEGATLTIEKTFIPLWFWLLYFAGIFIAAAALAFLLCLLFERVPALKLPLMSAACVIVALLAGC